MMLTSSPHSHRALIVRKLKGLERFIDVAIVHPYMGNLGWSFCPPVRDSEGGYPKTEVRRSESAFLELHTRAIS